MKTNEVNPNLKITEAAFTARVVELCQTLGWRVVHFRPGRTEEGWRTPVQGDGEGFPDIQALKDKRLVVVELKSDEARGATEAQHEWLVAFHAVGAETFIWRPSDWPEILKTFDTEGRLK